MTEPEPLNLGERLLWAVMLWLVFVAGVVAGTHIPYRNGWTIGVHDRDVAR